MLEIAIPEASASNKEKSTKDLVFSILSEDYPKTLTHLHREIKRKYGVSVTFQAVLKAVNSLVNHDVLVKEDKLYSLNKEWIFNTRKFFDNLYTEHFKVKRPLKKVELGRDVIIYTLNNLLELDRLWNDLLTTWAKEEKGDKRNVWKGKHTFWLLPRLQEEDILHDFMQKQGIKTYNLSTENTPLDKIAVRYYNHKGGHAKINKRLKLPSDIHIAAFGENLMKFEIPKELSKKLEKLYTNTKKLEDLNMKEAIDIFKENHEIELTIIKDKMLADKIRDEVISYF